MTDSYERRPTLEEVHARLKVAGIQPGPQGYDRDAVANGVVAKGWRMEYCGQTGHWRAEAIKEIAPSQHLSGIAPDEATLEEAMARAAFHLIDLLES